MKNFAKALIVLGLGTSLTNAQDLNETLKKMGESAGKAYVAPIVSSFGSNLNGSWYHKAPPPKKFGINFEAGIVSMFTLLGNGEKNLNVAGAFQLNEAQATDVANGVDTTGLGPVAGQQLRDSVAAALQSSEVQVVFSGPTVIGSNSETMTFQTISQPITVGTAGGDTTITLPVVNKELEGVTGILGDLPLLPLGALQATVGTVYGTNLTIRYLPSYEITDIGKVKFSGFGIQHNPGVWLGSSLPVDLSVGFFTQSLEVGSLFKASTQALGLNVSKTLGWRFLNLTPYGGIQFENSTFDFSYDLVVNDIVQPIAFSLDGENKYRATAGLSIRLFTLNINADYNIGKYSSFTAGAMIGI